MKIQSAVKRYTAFIGGGVLLLTAVMLAVFAALGQMDVTVILGALWGAGFSVLNFFLMGLAVQAATEMPVEPTASPADKEEAVEDAQQEQPLAEDAKRIKRKIQLSYTLRMMMMVLAGVIALAAPCFHTIAAVLPMLFPRIVILFQGILNKKEV